MNNNKTSHKVLTCVHDSSDEDFPIVPRPNGQNWINSCYNPKAKAFSTILDQQKFQRDSMTRVTYWIIVSHHVAIRDIAVASLV